VDAPHVTVLRPCKGFDPYLYECLASAFEQDYPSNELTIHLCVSSRDDPAYPVLQRIIRDFPKHDARIFVEDDDPALKDGSLASIGPNPKIRNMSRAYREAKGDILWIIDCNVWVNHGACGRMVDKLLGLSHDGPQAPYKFVHHLPICVDVDNAVHGADAPNGPNTAKTLHRVRSCNDIPSNTGGGRLEEVFLASSHAKFYTAINTVAVAPCIVGKSNMFRRSHLNALTSALNTSTTSTSANVGINHFSYNICEDHLIGDLLWRGTIEPDPLDPSDAPTTRFKNHGLVWGDLAIQPIAGMSVAAYIARRVRWLRVRKFTVTLATLVEPGTESFLCSAYGAFAVSYLPWFRENLPFGLSSSSHGAWVTFTLFWLLSASIWAGVDWTEYILLHSGRTIETETTTDGQKAEIPAFARPLLKKKTARRPFREWLFAWVGREALALPIWIWAFWGGVTVVWRDRTFWVGMDMRVHEIDDVRGRGKGQNGHVEVLDTGRKIRME
jgi:ceramide glucosyltransferase